MSSTVSSEASPIGEGGDHLQEEALLQSHASSHAVASSHSWLPYYWRPTSSFSLAYAEALVLNRIPNSRLTSSFLMLPCGAEIRTLRAVRASNGDDPGYLSRTPLLLLHGMGAAIGLWCRNIGPLCQQRPVYAVDILGFGRSSRVPFPLGSLDSEARFVDSIEHWRLAAGLTAFHLLGHSFGGYLAFCYAVKYPEPVRHLILADPWGLLEPPADYQPSSLLRRVASVAEYWRLDPLDLLRAAGPFGPGLVRRFRGDIRRFFSAAGAVEDGRGGAEAIQDCGDDILEYVYHCNAQVPSGETGFRRLTHILVFARHPGLQRAHQLRPDLPVTVVYGGRSLLYRMERARGQPSVGEKLRAARPAESRGEDLHAVYELPDCGHHIYAEDWRTFNSRVLDACDRHG